MNRASLLYFLFPSAILFVCELPAQRTDLQKHGLKGPVYACKTVCYTLDKKQVNGKKMERSNLEYAGFAHDIDTYFVYTKNGHIAEEIIEIYPGKTQSRIYAFDTEWRIKGCEWIDNQEGLICTEEYQFDSLMNPVQILVFDTKRVLMSTKVYEYDLLNRAIALKHYDHSGRLQQITDRYQYDADGNKLVTWRDGDVNYRMVIDRDDLCIEESGRFTDGVEYYQTKYKYDLHGKRIEAISYEKGKIKQIDNNPLSDNILDEGKVTRADKWGNWAEKLFDFGDRNLFVVVRNITYFEP